MPTGAACAEFTVAIATLNRPERLRRCVTALLGGCLRPRQLIIVDQSSDETTDAMVRSCAWNQHTALVYLRPDRLGLAACRNIAIAQATQPIVAFTDDDCVPGQHWLAALRDAFQGSERPDAVTGSVLPLGPARADRYPVSLRSSRRPVIFRGRALPWALGTGGNAAVRREWLDRVGGFDDRLGVGSPGRSAEDLDLLYRLVRSGAVMRYEPSAVVFHEQQSRDGRLSRASSYGFGLGALCSLWARQRDPFTAWIALRWAVDRCDTMLRATVRGQWWRIREELMTIAGAASGVGYGRMLAAELQADAGAPFTRALRQAVR
jgi:GT2 family glycosyltransferase